MWIAKNNDLIILAKNTKEELEEAIKFMVYTSIEETAIEYQEYSGQYLTIEEIVKQEQERINNLTMTALDFINFLKQAGLTDEMIEIYLNNNLNVKHQLQFCQNVYCGVAKQIFAEPITIGNVTITADMVELAFRIKNGEVVE